MNLFCQFLPPSPHTQLLSSGSELQVWSGVHPSPPPSVWVGVRCCGALAVVLLLEVVGIPVVQQLQTSRAAIFTPAAFFRPMKSGGGIVGRLVPLDVMSSGKQSYGTRAPPSGSFRARRVDHSLVGVLKVGGIQ